VVVRRFQDFKPWPVALDMQSAPLLGQLPSALQIRAPSRFARIHRATDAGEAASISRAQAWNPS
jgi:hypothetical protein